MPTGKEAVMKKPIGYPPNPMGPIAAQNILAVRVRLPPAEAFGEPFHDQRERRE